MSAGDHRHDGAAADAELVEKYRALAEPLVDSCLVDRTHTVPWLANRTRDCKTVYIDESVPAVLPKTGIDTGRTLPWHEIPECLAMDDGLPYDEGTPNAHSDVATPLERAAVERQGGDWAEYCEEMDGYIKAVDREAMTDIPADIDVRPFTDDDDRGIIDELIAGGELDAGSHAMNTAPPGSMDDPATFARWTSAPSRFVTAAPVQLRAEDDRTIDYVFSDESVARDGNTIATAGWELTNYLANPVFLWAHDQSSPPIGRVVQIGAAGAQLRGTVRYATRDEYPFADTIFKLTRGGYLNATSVSWLPIEWRHSSDKKRPGGIDFLRQDLLEISKVPVPALATALATARSAGIDTGPLFDWASRALDLGGFAVLPRLELETLRREARMASGKTSRAKKAEDWKVGASRDLPVEDKDGWDGPAAAGRMLAAAGFDGDSPDSANARKGFLLYDSANPGLKGSYKEPFADVIDGELKAIAGGIRAAASRLPQVEGVPQAAKDGAREVIDHYETKMKDDKGRAAPKLNKRSLWHVGWLAMILDDLGCVQNMSECEAAIEGDGSPVPGELLEAMKALGAVLVKMTIEEVDELIAGKDEDDAVVEVLAYASGLELKRGAFAAMRRLEPPALAGLMTVMRDLAAGRRVFVKTEDADAFAPLVRAGRVLSAENERCLRDALDLHNRACTMIQGVVDKNQPDDEPDDANPEEEDGDEARAMRKRKAGARRLKHKAAPAA